MAGGEKLPAWLFAQHEYPLTRHDTNYLPANAEYRESWLTTGPAMKSHAETKAVGIAPGRRRGRRHEDV